MKRFLPYQLTCFIACILLISSFPCFSQDFFLLDSYSNIYKSTAGNACSNIKLASCVSGVTDIAYYKDTLYSITQSGALYRSLVSQPAVACTFVTGFNFMINSLTVDSTGTVYAAGGSRISSYKPSTGIVKYLGSIPATFSSGGDLTFYKGKLYLAALLSYEFNNACLVEVNVENPSLSTLFMKLRSVNVFGCITLPKSCDENGFYITSLQNALSYLTEVDMVNKVELTPVCNYNIFVYGAASSTESGAGNKPQIDSIVNKPACINVQNGGSLKIFTGNSGSLLTYTLNGSASNQTGFFPGVPAGAYRIRIRSELGCLLDTAVTIAAATLPSIAIVAVDPLCSNNNGTITVQPLGGGVNLYAINNGAYQSSNGFQNLAAGRYTLAAVNESGCTTQKEAMLTLPLLDTSGSSFRTINSTCNGSNGSIQALVPNAAMPVSFSLNNAAPSANSIFPNLAPAAYLLSVTDGMGCRLDTPVLILTTPVPVIDSIAAPLFCADQASGGSISVFARHTAEVFTYSLNNAATNQSGLFTNLHAGAYPVRIANQYGCSKDSLVSLQAVANPVFSLTAKDPSCKGADGLISAQPAGTNILFSLNGGVYNNVTQFTRLSPGTYSLTAKNQVGCTTASAVVLTIPSLNSKGVQVHASDPACTGDDGGIAVALHNITPPVLYSLDGAASGTGVFTGLHAAAYKLTVTDGNSCRFDTTITLVKAPVTTPATGIKKAAPSCPFASDGSIALSVTGNDGPYAVSVNGSPFSFSYLYAGLKEGNYSFRVRNKRLCAVDSFSIKLAVAVNAVCNFIHFPNAFTPNSDGNNDLFKPVVRGVTEMYVLVVYNRLGQKVFETNDPTAGWNGTVNQSPQGTGAFVWFSRYKFYGDGQTEKMEKGTVMIIR